MKEESLQRERKHVPRSNRAGGMGLPKSVGAQMVLSNMELHIYLRFGLAFNVFFLVI